MFLFFIFYVLGLEKCFLKPSGLCSGCGSLVFDLLIVCKDSQVSSIYYVVSPFSFTLQIIFFGSSD